MQNKLQCNFIFLFSYKYVLVYYLSDFNLQHQYILVCYKHFTNMEGPVAAITYAGFYMASTSTSVP